MAGGSAIVGLLRTILTLDTASYEAGSKKAIQSTDQTEKKIAGLNKEVQKLTPQAERMVKAFSGDKLLYSANSTVAAITKIGGATKLTEQEQARANATLANAIDKYKALGQTAPQALLAMEKATRGSSSGLLGITGGVGDVIKGLGPLGPAVTGAFSVTAILGFAKAATDAAGNLVKLHDTTQLSFQGLQKFQIVGDDAGNSIEELDGAVVQLQKRLGDDKPPADFLAALNKIGLSAKELKSLSPERQFFEIGDGLKTIIDPAERVNTAAAIFGKQGASVLPSLVRNFDDVRDAAVGMSDDTIVALDNGADEIEKFFRRAKNAAADWIVYVAKSLGDNDAALHDMLKVNADVAEQLPAMLKKAQAAIDPAGKTLTHSVDELKDAEDRLTKSAKDSIEAHEEQARVFKALHEVMNDTIADFSAVSLRLEKAFDEAADAKGLADLKAEIDSALQPMNDPSIVTSALDEERLRNKLIGILPQIKPIAGKVGETVGSEISNRIADAFEDIPHLITSSILHSGGFLNGLKALGVEMADAIAEPFLKGLIKRIAGSKIQSLIANTAGGLAVGGAVGAAGGSYVASEVAGTAAAAGGGAAGGSALGGLAAFATNPITLAVAGAAVGGILLARHLNRGARANDVRDKDLAQFAGFDPPGISDPNNPKGFHGLAAVLAKYSRSSLFQPFVTANSPDAVRKNFAPIVSFFSGLGRPLTSYAMGGFVAPGTVQPAIVHGGTFGEDITPRTSANSRGAGNVFNFNLRADGIISPETIRRFWRQMFLPEVLHSLRFNDDDLLTTLEQVLQQ